MFPLCESHPDTDGDQSSKGRDDDESDPQRLSEGQVLDDFWYADIMSIIGPLFVSAQDARPSVCQRGMEISRVTFTSRYVGTEQ